MSKIPIGVQGRVMNTPQPGLTVRVENDSEDTGGFLIYQWWHGSQGPNQHGAFDDWVESVEGVEKFFAQKGWSVNWDRPSNS
jgi:hypothetical protein